MRLSQLWVYPIKSCAGFRQQGHELLQTGLRWDRQWMVTTEDGSFLTQRQEPRMALIETGLDSDHIWFRTPGMKERIFLGGASEQIIHAQVWGSKVKADLDQNPATHQILSDFLSRKVRLVTVGTRFRREVPEYRVHTKQKVYFADSHPLLITNEETLADFNRGLQSPVRMMHFRPNLVIQGAPSSAEDQWHQIQIGPVRIECRKLCSRCSIVDVDPQTGTVPSKEPLISLAKFKRRGRHVYFGVRGWARAEGLLHENDDVQILSLKAL